MNGKVDLSVSDNKLLNNRPLGHKDNCMCTRCGKSLDKVKLRGFSLICPVCGNPQETYIPSSKQNDSKQNNSKHDLYSNNMIICRHCKKPIDKVNLLGFSLLCPLCGKPQNGEPHIKIIEK